MQTALAALLLEATKRLEPSETARLDAELLLAHALGCERMALFTLKGEVEGSQLETFHELIARRSSGEPVAHLTGYQAFWEHDFLVTSNTLVPRQDTETLVEQVLKYLPDQGRILDLGTGTGCILLSLLHERPRMTGLGLDVSPEALCVAAENAERLGLSNRVKFEKSDWFSALEGKEDLFSAIVSNPPYIPTEDIEDLMSDVRNFEPTLALDGGSDGLTPYREIASKALEYLDRGGLLAVEVGVLQCNDVADLFESSGLKQVTITRDLPGIERVVSGKKS